MVGNQMVTNWMVWTIWLATVANTTRYFEYISELRVEIPHHLADITPCTLRFDDFSILFLSSLYQGSAVSLAIA